MFICCFSSAMRGAGWFKRPGRFSHCWPLWTGATNQPALRSLPPPIALPHTCERNRCVNCYANSFHLSSNNGLFSLDSCLPETGIRRPSQGCSTGLAVSRTLRTGMYFPFGLSEDMLKFTATFEQRLGELKRNETRGIDGVDVGDD